MRGLEESERMAKTRRQTEKEKEYANGLRVNFPWWDNVVEGDGEELCERE